MNNFEEYANKYESIHMERRDGILQITFHTNQGHLEWAEVPHRELGFAFADIGADRENKVIIMTGTGDAFIGRGCRLEALCSVGQDLLGRQEAANEPSGHRGPGH